MTKIKPSQGNQTFCMAPWVHSYLSPTSERRMCCASTEPAQAFKQYIDTTDGSNQYDPKTLKQHWNSEHMKSVRQRMMAGEILDECKVCNNNLLQPASAYRGWFNNIYKDFIDQAFDKTDEDGHTDMECVSFDYRFTNLCNFKCRMCGSNLSSSWEAEEKKTVDNFYKKQPWAHPDVKNKQEKFVTNIAEKEMELAIKNRTIKETYWVGGEPLMYEQHWKYMKMIVDEGLANQVKARYNTNLSRITYKNIHLFDDILKHFDYFHICASIDGTESIGEWIRTGLNYKQFIENFENGLRLHNGRNKRMSLDFTLTLPGLFEVENMVDLANKYNVQLISKVVFEFSSEVLMCPLSLPKEILHRKIDEIMTSIKPKINHNTQGIIDLLQHLKTRPTFAEKYPDYKQGFLKGKKFHAKLEKIRSQKITIADILSQDNEIFSWWNNEEI